MIIDECLSIQNKNSLQTEEAWKQSLFSKHLIMMSATFFKTRFDNLYYMLKMLQSGLPEEKKYLDAILLENMSRHLSLTKRKWKSNINYFELDQESIDNYEKIEQINGDIHKKYTKLTSYLTSNNKVKKTIVKQLRKLITELENDNQKCLIYAASKHESEYWSEKLNIPIYGSSSNGGSDKHVIVSYATGTYGLNDLTSYNCIVMRPPALDQLVQIKGRLDRPGQTKNNLRIEYFLLKNTIEESLLMRMNISKKFVDDHMKPLTHYYTLFLEKKYGD
jgi:hypothetical protein